MSLTHKLPLHRANKFSRRSQNHNAKLKMYFQSSARAKIQSKNHLALKFQKACASYAHCKVLITKAALDTEAHSVCPLSICISRRKLRVAGIFQTHIPTVGHFAGQNCNLFAGISAFEAASA